MTTKKSKQHSKALAPRDVILDVVMEDYSAQHADSGAVLRVVAAAPSTEVPARLISEEFRARCRRRSDHECSFNLMTRLVKP